MASDPASGVPPGPSSLDGPSASGLSAPERIFEQMNATRRQLLTPARATISATWGAVVSLSADAILGHGPTWVMTAPLAALPSVWFLMRDEQTAGRPIDPLSFGTALVGGGTAALIVGKTAGLAVRSLLG